MDKKKRKEKERGKANKGTDCDRKAMTERKKEEKEDEDERRGSFGGLAKDLRVVIDDKGKDIWKCGGIHKVLRDVSGSDDGRSKHNREIARMHLV